MIAAATNVAIARSLLIVISFALWHWTQKMLARRNPSIETSPPRPSETGWTAEASSERARLIQRLIDGEEEQPTPAGLRAGERSRLVQRLLDGNDDLPSFFNDLLATMAVSVAGTEAAGFVIERSGDKLSLKNIAHIRPDESEPATRTAALKAFQELIKPCILRGKDGALEVGGTTPENQEPQYCLITLLRDAESIVAVGAIITRCQNLQRARQRLLTLQLLAGYFSFHSHRWNFGDTVKKASADRGRDIISDGIHRLTARINQRLLDNPRQANALLIASSLVIDLLGVYLLASAVIGPSIAPFLGLFMVFGLRQIVQAFCPLPPPVGMIWRSPGVPSLLVTYGTSCDLFFSGHTAIAVYGCATLADALGPTGIAIGCAIVAFEIWTVLVLRAHYTMDVFAGALAALYVHRLVIDFAPFVDEWIRHAVAHVT